MRVVELDREEPRPEADAASVSRIPATPVSADLDSLRSFLVAGTHAAKVDPRRRQGAHRRWREMLVGDQAAVSVKDPLRALASALDRQAFGQLLSNLAERERQIVKMAYLDGKANREIASAIGVSISTVQRSLRRAISRLEAEKAAKWLSVALLLPLLHALARSLKLSKAASLQPMQVVLGAGTAVVAAVALITLAPTAPSTVQAPGHFIPPSILKTAPASSGTSDTASVPAGDDSRAASHVVKGAVSEPTNRRVDPTPSKATNDAAKGCDGNPTSAPPGVPVASRSNHPTQAPVSHPSAGGCGT